MYTYTIEPVFLRSYIGGIFLSLHRKNGLFCNMEQPKSFIQQPSLNIMDVLRHKTFGCSAIYDQHFLRQDESSSFWGGNGKSLDESGSFGGKMENIWIYLPR